MWIVYCRVLGSEEGCDAGIRNSTTERSRELNHLDTSIIHKMPAATKGKRDQNYKNGIS